jgi:predicted GNAT family acetyltransferase
MAKSLIELRNADIPALKAFIAPEPEVNLFIYGDVTAFGLESPHVQVTAFLGEKGAFESVLLRYQDRNYVFYGRGAFDPKEIAARIKKDNPTLRGVCLSGKKALLDPIAPSLRPLAPEDTMMARCDRLDPHPQSYPSFVKARTLGEGDFHALYLLLSSIAEFRSFAAETEKEATDGKKLAVARGSVLYGVYVRNELVATAASTADSPECSMVVGVATKEGYRKKGYASLAVQSLLKDRFGKGQKFVCLFYDNPEAGQIYHKFGFVDVAPYTMIH